MEFILRKIKSISAFSRSFSIRFATQFPPSIFVRDGGKGGEFSANSSNHTTPNDPTADFNSSINILTRDNNETLPTR